jgi:hypothetical protein
MNKKSRKLIKPRKLKKKPKKPNHETKSIKSITIFKTGSVSVLKA